MVGSVQLIGQVLIPCVDAFNFPLSITKHSVRSVGTFPSSVRMFIEGTDALLRRTIQYVINAMWAPLWPTLRHSGVTSEQEHQLAALALLLAVGDLVTGVAGSVRIPNDLGPRATSL